MSRVLWKSTPQALAFEHKLSAIASGEGARVARAAIGGRLLSLIDEGFRMTRDPRGQAWAARKPPTGNHPLLQLSGKMRSGYKVTTTGPRVTISNNATSEQGRAYPLFHQKGTRKMDARKHVPDRTLSTHWRAEITKVIALAFKYL